MRIRPLNTLTRSIPTLKALTHRICNAPLGLILLVSMGLSPAVMAQQQPDAGIRAFTSATLIDGSGAEPISDAVLLVEEGRILAVGSAEAVDIPSGAEVMDLAGLTIMPGMINIHGHAGNDSAAKLRTYARYGVTTVVSLGGEDEAHVRQRDNQATAELDTARLFVAGPIINPDSPAAAREAVDQLADMQVDWVKFRIEDGNMPEEIYAAIIEQAHAKDLRVAAHMYHLGDSLGLLRHGVDLLAHSVRDQPMEATALELMRQQGACLSPTLMREVSTYVYHERPAFFDDPFFQAEAQQRDIDSLLSDNSQRRAAGSLEQGQQMLAMAMQNLQLVNDAGLPIAMGTDSGAFTGRFPGYFEHMELALMEQAGMSAQEVIHSATGVAAQCAGLEEVGTLVAGNWADFIILEENPLEDILHTRSIVQVMIAGNPVQ